MSRALTKHLLTDSLLQQLHSALALKLYSCLFLKRAGVYVHFPWIPPSKILAVHKHASSIAKGSWVPFMLYKCLFMQVEYLSRKPSSFPTLAYICNVYVAVLNNNTPLLLTAEHQQTRWTFVRPKLLLNFLSGFVLYGNFWPRGKITLTDTLKFCQNGVND